MTDREALIRAFLEDAGWQDAVRAPVPGDASTRRYERLVRRSMNKGVKAVLMDAPKAAEGASEPEGATVDERKSIGYNAVARLAGPNIEAFAAIATALSTRGFSAPKILAADLENGFLLLEDLGDDLFARVIEKQPEQEEPLYVAAVDTLAAIYRSSFPAELPFEGTSWRVRTYDEAALLAELDLCLDWYAKDLGYNIQDGARAEWEALWRVAFTTLDAHAPGLALRDYHAENLFWLSEREGTSRVGLIDFQDGLFVHPTYDLVSFIEDARRDVSPELADPLIARFCEKAGVKDDADFRAAYAVMGAQRNSKVIGFPVRADLMFGKPQYRALIPRVRKHLNHDLSHPALKDIRRWYQRHIPEIIL